MYQICMGVWHCPFSESKLTRNSTRKWWQWVVEERQRDRTRTEPAHRLRLLLSWSARELQSGKSPGSTKILVHRLEIFIKRPRKYSVNKKEASRGHGKDTAKIWKIHCIPKLGIISCRNGGSNAPSLKEMAEEHKTGEKQEYVLQNKNIKWDIILYCSINIWNLLDCKLKKPW